MSEKIVLHTTPMGSKRFSVMSDTERCNFAAVTGDAEALDMLAYDDNVEVRLDVAYNNMAGTNTLERLARDKNASIRFWVAKNPNVSDTVLRVLAHDSDKSVRWQARSHISNRRKPL